MKGIVFTEFLDHVTNQLGIETCEQMIEACDLTDDGAYTGVGTYDHKELVEMVAFLHEKTGTPVATLVEGFGQSLFGILSRKYPMFIEGIDDSFTLLKQIEDVIHVNVRKLYPDAELPTFSYEQPNESVLLLEYRSSRGFADLAVGLMKGCFLQFGEQIDLQREELAEPVGTHVRFTLRSQA